MYKDIPTFEPPADRNDRVWRYMSIDKFQRLMTDKALYFSRVDRFDDKFEGLLSHKSKAQWSALAEWIRDARQQTFVSCWQLNTHESEQMWQLYLRGEPGIAIESSFRRLTESLAPCPEVIFVGKVRYIDYDTDSIQGWDKNPNIYTPIMHKRMEYRADQEVRAVLNTMSNLSLQAKNTGELGLLIPVELKSLIERVRLMPGAESDVRVTVEQLLNSNGITGEVLASALDSPPP